MTARSFYDVMQDAQPLFDKLKSQKDVQLLVNLLVEAHSVGVETVRRIYVPPEA